MSRVKSRAPIDVCGDCGASGSFIFTFCFHTKFTQSLYRIVFVIRSVMGIDKSWHLAVRRVLFGAPQSGTSHIASEVAAPGELVAVGAELRERDQRARRQQCLGALPDGCGGAEELETEAVAQGSAASDQGRVHSGETRQSIVYLETKCATIGGRGQRESGSGAQQAAPRQRAVEQPRDFTQALGPRRRSEFLQ